MYKKVLLPVSFEEGRDSEKALGVAKLLADPGMPVTVLHVVEEVPPYIVQYLPDNQLEKNFEDIEKILRDRFAGVPDLEVDVIEGHAGYSIVEYATENNYDCIVISSHRPGLQDYFLGSTAARVVRHAPCSVHVVR